MAISFDQVSIKNRILSNLASKEEWAKAISYGVNDTLLDGITQEMAYEMQGKEKYTFENWWNKARNKSSLLVQSPVHGYVMPRKNGAIGTLKVSTAKNFNNSYNKNIPIPKYFEFSNGEIFVVSDNNYILNSGSNYVSIQAKQGTKQVITFLAQGLEFETKIINDPDIDDFLFDLYVNDVLWTKVNSLFDYSPTDTVYEIIISASLDKATLKFGNNIFGKKLNINDSVKFYYSSTLGTNGNIYSIDNIDTVETQAYDIEGTPITLYVTNTSSFLGGRDFPTIEEIRNNSPRVYQSGDRASSIPDWLVNLQNFIFISKSLVWGALEYIKDHNLNIFDFIPTEENVIHICALNNTFDELTTLQKEEILTDLYPKHDPTDIIVFELTEKILIDIYCSAVLRNFTYILNTEKSNIETVLENNYNIENTDYQEGIDFSNFTSLIDAVASVKKHDSYIRIVKIFNFTEAYISNVQLPIYPIDGETVVVYLKLKTDPESSYSVIGLGTDEGTINGSSSTYVLTGSYINTANGSGVINIVSGIVGSHTLYDIKVSYKTFDNNISLTNRNQIISLHSTNIIVNYPSTI